MMISTIVTLVIIDLTNILDVNDLLGLIKQELWSQIFW